MISSSTWVPRGYASEFPEKYELDDEEMARINEIAKLEISDAKEELSEAQKASSLKDQIEIDDDLKKYNLETYDAEDDDYGTGENITMFPGLSSSDAKMYENGEGEEGENDMYLMLPTEVDEQEEKQENQIYPTDNLVLATRTEDDISWLDVYIYDDGAGAPAGAEEEEEDKLDNDVAKGLVRDSALYVHHDIMLPAFPLCVEWVNYKPESDGSNIGNFAAVGTFDPQIELWNLDFVDKAFPDVILGEMEVEKEKKKKKKKKSTGHVTTHHTDAVLSLSHNKIHRSVLASTSADKTVKLWDLSIGQTARSMDKIHHGKTVSSSQWHSTEASILLTGGYDASVALTDVRISEVSQMSKYYTVTGGEDVENVRWSSNPEFFFAGTDQGNVFCFDIRNESKALWTLHAHDAGISSLDINRFIPGMLVTSAMGEKTVKLWRASENTTSGPSMVLSRDFGLGNVLTVAYAPDIEVAGNLVIGGVTGGLKMWDTFTNKSVKNVFEQDLVNLKKRARDEAKRAGRASRIARKYQVDANDIVLEVEGSKNESESEDEDEDV
ncbi:PWP1 [Candida oxycetoniae]|uniref:PWP1 n=1 Tax=Candida oxycetoniae TaxID=497107 RepID=A0AAI9WWN3_9ASCO|nr:PWP1 [Candida oxycetoniae]KAI3403367.2 PWP1 [Candida oxycetoniae]